MVNKQPSRLVETETTWKFQGRLKAPNPMSAFMRYQRYQDGDGRRCFLFGGSHGCHLDCSSSKMKIYQAKPGGMGAK